MIATPSRIRPRTRKPYQRGLGLGLAFVGGGAYPRDVFFCRCLDFGMARTMLPGLRDRAEVEPVLGGSLHRRSRERTVTQLAGGPQGRLVVPMGRRRVARLAGAQDRE